MTTTDLVGVIATAVMILALIVASLVIVVGKKSAKKASFFYWLMAVALFSLAVVFSAMEMPISWVLFSAIVGVGAVYMARKDWSSWS